MSYWLHTHPHASSVCAYFVSHYFKHLSRTHKHSDTVTQPSVIDSVCAARPLLFLGDAITVLNAYTKGRADTVCVPASVCLCVQEAFTEHVFHWASSYTPHGKSWLCMFVNRFKSSVCWWSVCMNTLQECIFTARTRELEMHDIRISGPQFIDAIMWNIYYGLLADN